MRESHLGLKTKGGRLQVSENSFSPVVELHETVILPYTEQDGELNMSVDRSLREKVSANQKTYLRFYGWTPWAISLGHSQNSSTFDKAKLEAQGIDIVRRPTGGRAVFHAQELTYCIVTPTSGPKYNRYIYQKMHEAIGAALSQIQIKTDYQRKTTNLRDHYSSGLEKACFTSSARYELTLNEKKIVGSAQRNYGDVLLQHGSILLGPAHFTITDYMIFGEAKTPTETEQIKSRFNKVLRESSTDILTETGVEVDPISLSERIIGMFNANIN